MERHRRKFERCYRKGFRRWPGLAGTVIVRMLVDDEGEVEKAFHEGGTLNDPKVIDFIVDEAEDVEFKRPVGRTVVYPLEFRP